ncbi:heme-binding protein 2-like [Ruditapes philippinarum]|uniref:heme-binding protein 2-like n=1 Tax=Ruditapes philippinarum TaxID=129788 RepID=UPI00295C2DCF|nr:heme-binding protein 2-like [Ruditapes philippinarum]
MMIIKLTCLVASSILVLNLGVAAEVPAGFKTPWFCHDLECPVYQVVETNSNFETRHYNASVWIATQKSLVNNTRETTRDMFFKLFHYISGNNSAHLKIPMTAPVLKQIGICQGQNCKADVTEHFMMPFNLQANPPTPTETGVFIRRLPEFTVYVRSYGGYGSETITKQNLDTLMKDLQTANKLFKQDHYYTAGYDGPYAFIRHNEVWIAAL